MRYVQKIVRNGNTNHVAIPRQVLTFLGWLPGSLVVCDVLEGNRIQIRPLEIADQAPKHTQPRFENASDAVSR